MMVGTQNLDEAADAAFLSVGLDWLRILREHNYQLHLIADPRVRQYVSISLRRRGIHLGAERTE